MLRLVLFFESVGVRIVLDETGTTHGLAFAFAPHLDVPAKVVDAGIAARVRVILEFRLAEFYNADRAEIQSIFRYKDQVPHIGVARYGNTSFGPHPRDMVAPALLQSPDEIVGTAEKDDTRA